MKYIIYGKEVYVPIVRYRGNFEGSRVMDVIHYGRQGEYFSAGGIYRNVVGTVQEGGEAERSVATSGIVPWVFW